MKQVIELSILLIMLLISGCSDKDADNLVGKWQASQGALSEYDLVITREKSGEYLVELDREVEVIERPATYVNGILRIEHDYNDGTGLVVPDPKAERVIYIHPDVTLTTEYKRKEPIIE